MIKFLAIFVIIFSINLYSEDMETDANKVIQTVEKINIEENIILGKENESCSNGFCDENLFCNKDNICQKKPDSMDFSKVIVESDQIDENDEKKEEKAILKSLKDKRKKIKTASLKSKTKAPTKFLEFLPLYLDISYLNMSTLDIPNNHNLAVEFGTSIFSIILSKFEVKIARVALAPTYKFGLSALEFSPVSFAYRLNHKVHRFQFELELYKTYYLFNKFRVKRALHIVKWIKYVSLKSSWYILKDNKKDLKLFFETALVSGDHRDSSMGVSFSLGISGSFSPLQFSF